MPKPIRLIEAYNRGVSARFYGGAQVRIGDEAEDPRDRSRVTYLARQCGRVYENRRDYPVFDIGRINLIIPVQLRMLAFCWSFDRKVGCCAPESSIFPSGAGFQTVISSQGAEKGFRALEKSQMAVAPYGFLPQSSRPDQGEIREREQAAETFFRSLLAEPTLPLRGYPGEHRSEYGKARRKSCGDNRCG